MSLTVHFFHNFFLRVASPENENFEFSRAGSGIEFFGVDDFFSAGFRVKKMDLVTLRRPRPFYPPTTGFSHNIFFRLILSTTTSLQLIVFVL